MAGSLDRVVLIGAATVFLVTLLGLAVALTSMRSYIRLSRRDMGVLRHLGHSATTVSLVYGRRIMSTIGWSLTISLTVTVVAGFALLRDEPALIAADAGALVALATLITWIARVQLRRVAHRPVLELLTLQREFD